MLTFKKKVDVIILSDIPKYPYYIEALFCILIDFKKILSSISYLFQKKYNFFYYKKLNDLLINNNNYNYQIFENLNEDKFSRNSIIFRKKI